MNICEKQSFVLGLAWAVISKVILNLNKLPYDWNGFELRQMLADEFADAASPYAMDKRRKAAYQRWMINHWE